MATIFGGDTGLSYEDVQRKRKIADALLAQNMRGSQNVPQGLTSVARALAAKSIENKTGQAMEGLNAEADAIFNSIFGGGGGTFAGMGATGGMGASGGMGPTSPAPVPGVRTSGEGEAVADDAMATLVKMGLTERGLPEHVADGFVMNARDESGLSTDINEIAPLVPGSRGGYGLMQWTGPRRVALEQAAAERGVAPSDLNLQLDTIVSELQGPEARAGQAILSTKDAPSAATAIVNDFLRPAPEHRARRAAAYGGQPSQGGGATPSVQAIAAAMANPVIQNDPGRMAILQSLLGQAMQANDPMRAMEMERAQLELEALRNPQPEVDYRSVGDTLVRIGPDGVTPVFQGEDSPLVDMSGASFGDRGETEYDKTRGKTFGERMAAYDADVAGASGAISTLDAMEGLMADPGFYSGSSGESILTLKRAASALGFDPEGVDSMEAFNSLAKKGALDAMGGSLGAGFSNADRDFVEGQVARLANTPEGNRLIISIQRKIQERRLQIAQMAQEYEQKNGRLDNGFDEQIRQFVETNPVFAGGLGGAGDGLSEDAMRFLEGN
jgi:hypothetical protein